MRVEELIAEAKSVVTTDLEERLVAALEERLRVNVGLVLENKQLRQELRELDGLERR